MFYVCIKQRNYSKPFWNPSVYEIKTDDQLFFPTQIMSLNDFPFKEIGPALAYFNYKTDIVESLSIEAPLILTLTAENFCGEYEVRVKSECGGEWRQESYEQKFNNYYITGKKDTRFIYTNA